MVDKRDTSPSYSAALWTVLLLSVSVGCGGQSPTSAYIEMTTAAQMGYKKGFLEGFTKESKALVDANITLTEAYAMNEFNPFSLLVFDSVDNEKIYEKGTTIGKKYKCRTECAVLKVRTNKKKRKILMVKEEDKWRIDMKELADYWKKEKKKW